MENNSKQALVLYWSHGGNTRDVAETIHAALQEDGRMASTLFEIAKDRSVRYDDYDLIFLGSPVYMFLPPPEVIQFLKDQQRIGRPVVAGAPEQPGKAAVVFCTYGGGHTGEREAIPTLKYLGQFLEHQGIRVAGEWAIVGDFPDVQDSEYRTAGRLGDITGRPADAELEAVAGRVAGLLRQLNLVLGLNDR